MLMRSLLVAALAMGLGAPASAAAEQRLGLGVFLLAGGVDVHYSLRPVAGHWSYGLRYLAWTDEFYDPFTGGQLTESDYDYVGLSVDYRFDPDARHGWYLSAELLRASVSERATLTGEVASDAGLAPYFGGGWSGLLGNDGYYDLGLLLSPGASLDTRTSVSSSIEDGLFDVRMIIGVRF